MKTIPWAAVVALAFTPASATSQQIEADSVIALAERILGSFGGGDGGAKVRMLALPPSLPSAVTLEADTRVRGSVELDLGLSLSFLEAADRRAQGETIASALEESGWRRHHPATAQYWAAPEVRDVATYCLDRVSLSIDGAEDEGPGELVLIHVTMRHFSTCAEPAAEASDPERPRFEPPLPRFGAPEGLRALGWSGSGSDRAWHAHTPFDGAPPLESIVTYYTEQLTALGAKMATHAAGEGAAISTFDYVDAQGRTWHGLLSASTLPAHARSQVVIHLMRIES